MRLTHYPTAIRKQGIARTYEVNGVRFRLPANSFFPPAHWTLVGMAQRLNEMAYPPSVRSIEELGDISHQ